MFKIYKYDLPVIDADTKVALPAGHQKLRIGTQDGFNLVIWCLVDPDAQTEECTYRVVGTGHDFPEAPGYQYFDTVSMPTGLVWHLFWKL